MHSDCQSLDLIYELYRQSYTLLLQSSSLWRPGKECLSQIDFGQRVVNQVRRILDRKPQHHFFQIKRILFLLRFCRFPADDPQKVKMTRILEELINLTVKEKGVGSVL